MAQVIGNSRNVEGCRLTADARPTIGTSFKPIMTGGVVDPATIPHVPGRRELARKEAAAKKVEHRRYRNAKRAAQRARKAAA